MTNPGTAVAGRTPIMPVARADGLIVEEFGDELLVYDLTRDKAHRLNRTAAFVWRRCDGQTTVAALAAALVKDQALEKDAAPATESTLRLGEMVVRMALDRLAAARLFTERLTMPASKARLSRRDVMRAAGISLLVPLVESIVAPRAAEAASSTTQSACFNNCDGVGLPCSDAPGKKCHQYSYQTYTVCVCT
jgi:hypothetical protein